MSGEVALWVMAEKSAKARLRRRLAAAAMLGGGIALLIASVAAMLEGVVPPAARTTAVLLGVAAGGLVGAAYYLAEPPVPRLGKARVAAEVVGSVEGLSLAERALVDALGAGPADVETIAARAGLDVEEVIPLLLSLERRGVVRVRSIEVE